MKWFFVFFLIFVIQDKIFMNEPEKIRGKILHNFLKETKTNDFYPIGTGGGSKNEKINLINITYYYKLPMTVESARVLMVNTVRNFLNYANSFPNIKEFLNESTLNVKNLNFGIIYPCWMDIPSEIKCVCLVLGKISYSIKEHEDGPFVDIHKESFEEAERIVAEQNLNR